MSFDFKNEGKMNLRIITKNHVADPEIGFLTKSISKPYADSVGVKIESPNKLKLTDPFLLERDDPPA